MKFPACLLCNLCLTVAIVTAGSNLAREVEDCDIKFEDNGACACSLHDRDGPVTCGSRRFINIQNSYCMYYDPTQNLSIVGHCYYSFYDFLGIDREITSSTEFNVDICSSSINRDANRRGRFCGRCKETYGMAVYSYQLFKCIPCQNYGYKNWLKYFAVALLPLTVFYIAAVLLSFNVTSSSLNGTVLGMQCVLSPLQVTMAIGAGHIIIGYNSLKAITSIFCTVNLDFFRLVYPPFCLHPNANVFQIMSLDYLVALYPFLLILMTYLLVTMYDRQYRVVVWMWRPVQRCVNYHRHTWNIRTSLIEIFATFILFSYVKILGVSVKILSFTTSHDVAGNKLKDYYTLLDGNIKYFGSAHLPYALLAIGISSVFVILPFLLLAVYPCRCFHKCLNYCGLRSQTLHVFMDAFQGSYKTEPHDLRYFSAFYPLLRLLMAVQFQIFPSITMLFTSGILFLAASAIVAIFQPYKVNAHNKIDIVLMMLLGMYFVSYHAQQRVNKFKVALVCQYICIMLLLLYFVSLLVWKLLGRKLQDVVLKAKAMWGIIVRNTRERSRGEGVESFDREVGSGEANNRTPLLREQN